LSYEINEYCHMCSKLLFAARNDGMHNWL